MKRVEELGISPTPWSVDAGTIIGIKAGGLTICDAWRTDTIDNPTAEANARLIAAAPYLYRALREAVSEMCNLTCESSHSECAKTARECFVARWRSALAKAAGEKAK